ncbi:DUF1028 domain-containing protein [Fulvivirgaceae bacterium BMA12]|uniref:DUF1028 domain-containing protein n=1 Tax=Agaribacillus aureus TaxID=3051825 RepID=A0ABT8L9C1_9BACT|nr:DUF1028 domain-containing protein [Fulvivirgaceae bacterium BMA12]
MYTRLTLFGIFVIFISSELTHAQSFKQENPLAHTYSIVARDPVTGDMAVGVQSHWFSVGTVVSWGEAGLGVIATQSFVNKSFGIRGLALLKEGKTPQEALEILLSTDAGKAVRQVSILDKHGQIATHTGDLCIKFAGHIIGKDFSVQANMMLNDQVWPKMAQAYEAADSLPLAERVLQAMKGAQAAGGDIRGQQSASILVIKGVSENKPWDERLIDLRVDDSKDPLAELERLLKVYRAYEHMNNGDLAVEKNDMPLASLEYQKAEEMFPDNLEMKYWHAITLLNNGDIQTASDMLLAVFKKDENWRKLTARLPASGILQLSEKDLNYILNLK